jgi:hypothetical protein
MTANAIYNECLRGPLCMQRTVVRKALSKCKVS